MTTAMVPLMTATLFVVVASQFPKISDQTGQVLSVVPIYASFLVVMAVIGLTAIARADFQWCDTQFAGCAALGTRPA